VPHRPCGPPDKTNRTEPTAIQAAAPGSWVSCYITRVCPDSRELEVAVPRPRPAVRWVLGVRQDDPRQGTAVTKNYQRTALDTSALTVPDQVSVAMNEIAANMQEGLLALAVGAGLQVMQQLMEANVTAACGPRGKHDPDRSATRHGSEAGSVTLGGRRVPVTRPRLRTTDGTGELPVPAYRLFNGTELLGRRCRGSSWR
jgi:hypothetical protein